MKRFILPAVLILLFGVSAFAQDTPTPTNTPTATPTPTIAAPATFTPIYQVTPNALQSKVLDESVLDGKLDYGQALINIMGGNFDAVKAQKITLTSRSFGGGTYTLTNADSGKILMATRASTFNLPTGAIGDVFIFCNGDGVATVINPQNADTILALTNAAGDSITNSTAGNMVILFCPKLTEWVALPYGTWADGN